MVCYFNRHESILVVERLAVHVLIFVKDQSNHCTSRLYNELRSKTRDGIATDVKFYVWMSSSLSELFLGEPLRQMVGPLLYYISVLKVALRFRWASTVQRDCSWMAQGLPWRWSSRRLSLWSNHTYCPPAICSHSLMHIDQSPEATA